MNNIFIRIYHENYKGGANNLQVCEVYQATRTGDRTLKRFTSTKAQALDRAKKYLKTLIKK